MSFDRMASAVALAEADLEDARHVVDERLEVRRGIHEQIAVKRTAVADLRARLASGDLSDKEAGGLAGLLAADLEDLIALREEADRGVADAGKAADLAAQALRQAQDRMSKALADADFRAFHDHVKSIEATFVSALAELGSLASRAGMPVSALRGFYSVGNDLTRAVSGSVVPPVRGAS